MEGLLPHPKRHDLVVRVRGPHRRFGVGQVRDLHEIRQEVAFHRGMGRFYRKFYAGRNPALDVAVYAGILGKLGISVTRSAVARRSIT